MTGKRVWFVTGAGRGMGVDIANAALAAGHTVVATGRNPKAVETAVGKSADLLVVKLDVTRLADAKDAVRLPSTGSATSASWSTTLATSTPASSKSCLPTTSRSSSPPT